jgi:hypothetical protein
MYLYNNIIRCKRLALITLPPILIHLYTVDGTCVTTSFAAYVYTCRSVEKILDDHRMRILEIPKTAAAIVTFRAYCPRRHIHSSPLGCGRCMQPRPATKVSEKTKHIYTVGCGSKRYYNYTDVVIYCMCQASIQNYFGCKYYISTSMIRYYYSHRKTSGKKTWAIGSIR